jgi:hypothetical protein
VKFGFHPAAEAEHLEQVGDIPSMYRLERPPDIRRALVTIAVAHATGFRGPNKSLLWSDLALRRGYALPLKAFAEE